MRSVRRDKRQSIEPTRRAEIRSASRYTLGLDVSNFYGSIYTHSIPWALHGKAVAKLDRSDKLYGNVIDRFVRNCQDGQTMGIPIGPDTSEIIAESILSSLDLDIPLSISKNGYRFMDDYEMNFKNIHDAEAALNIMQSLLNDYELDPNPSKTEIKELPSHIEDDWVSELRVLPISRRPAKQRYDLYYFFSRAFQYFADRNNKYVLRYAIRKSGSSIVHSSNWDVYQHLILQCMMAEPGCMRFVYDRD